VSPHLLYKGGHPSGLSVELRLDQYHWGYGGPAHVAYDKENRTMRTVFTIELKADIAAIDEERRKGFIDLATRTAEQFYAQASMIADKRPEISVKEVGGNGQINHPLFGGQDVTPSK
jgi:hypothetical protein